ncbi:MAG: hypothetical protein LUD83_07715 [Clostridiales bacterium]|nr:hypothetical protein [Clostridiales bacterium]
MLTMTWTSDNLYCIIGSGEADCTARLIWSVLEHGRPGETALLTRTECLWRGRRLPAPAWPSWRETLEAYLRALEAQGCRRAVLALSPSQIAAGWARGLRCRAAVVGGLREHDNTDALRGYLTGCCRLLVANLDDSRVRTLAAQWGGPKLTYAEKRGEAHLNARYLRLGRDRMTFEAVTDSAIARVSLALPGSYDFYMALAALGCGLLEGYTLREGAAAVSAAPGAPGVLELRRRADGPDELIHTSCTAPQLEAALLAARRAGSGRVLLVLALPPGGTDRRLRRIALQGADWCALIPAAGERPGGPDLPTAVRAARYRGEPEDIIVFAGRANWDVLLAQPQVSVSAEHRDKA